MCSFGADFYGTFENIVPRKKCSSKKLYFDGGVQ